MFTDRLSEFCASQFVTRYPITAAKEGERIQAAARVLATRTIKQDDTRPGVYLVMSERTGNKWYEVIPSQKSCTCPDHKTRATLGVICKHRLAVGWMLSADQWAEEDIHKTLETSHATAQNQAYFKSLSLAYTFATAKQYQLGVFCWTTYNGIKQDALVYSLGKDHTDELIAIVKRRDEKPWYGSETHLAVYAAQLENVFIQ